MPKIIVDSRESRFVADALSSMGAEVIKKMISPGDYVLSEGFAVERKTFRDFVQSIFKKRLFEQIERLQQAYPRNCLVIEGDFAYGLTRIRNPLVFWGALARATVEWNIPIVFTINEGQTAQFFFSLAKKLQEKGREEVKVRYKPKFYAMADKQRFAVQGLPGMGPKFADRLLRKFGGVRKVFTATDYELLKVEGFGKKRVKIIRQFLDAPYLASENKEGN